MFLDIITKVQIVFILLWQRQRWQMADSLQCILLNYFAGIRRPSPLINMGIFKLHLQSIVRLVLGGGRSSQVV